MNVTGQWVVTETYARRECFQIEEQLFTRVPLSDVRHHGRIDQYMQLFPLGCYLASTVTVGVTARNLFPIQLQSWWWHVAGIHGGVLNLHTGFFSVPPHTHTTHHTRCSPPTHCNTAHATQKQRKEKREKRREKRKEKREKRKEKRGRRKGRKGEREKCYVMRLTLRPMISHEVAKSNQVLKIKNLAVADGSAMIASDSSG